MTGIAGGGGGGGGYNYVQDATPSGAVEGEEWYDTGANAAYVYDGASWIEQTVSDHGQLSGVSAADHHAKPTGTATNSFSGGFADREAASKNGSVSANSTWTWYVTPPTATATGGHAWCSCEGSSTNLLEVGIEATDGTTEVLWTGNVDIPGSGSTAKYGGTNATPQAGDRMYVVAEETGGYNWSSWTVNASFYHNPLPSHGHNI